jgi:catechol 2,3-dioxygenase-like lactoylglutathione lyase family enzyme
MEPQFLHHVSIIVSDLARSTRFYTEIVGLRQMVRPPFKSKGAWLVCGEQHVHINEKPATLFTPVRKFDPTSFHFALRVADYHEAVKWLTSKGYRESETADDPQRLILDPNGPAGFPQAFIFDPDGNLIEFNAAVLSPG